MNRLRSDCMNCLMGRHLTKFPENTPEEKQIEYMQRIFALFAKASVKSSAPVLARDIYKIQYEMFGAENEYGEIKRHFNEVMMSYEDEVRGKISAADNPLKLAVQYAMVGNYIDFGAMKNVDETYLAGLLESARDTAVDAAEYGKMVHDLENGHRMVFLTDNCGEIVMDKILIETIKKLYPDLEVTVIVRGGEVINDATMEDARQVGLTETAHVIGSGSDIAGIHLPELSSEALETLKKADVILAKGQGNFETLRNCHMNVYYMFLCKCDMFAKDFGVEKFTGMLVNDRTWAQSKGLI